MTTRDTTHEAGTLGWLAHHLVGMAITLTSGIVSTVYGRGRSLRTKINALRDEWTASVRVLAETASLAEAHKAEGGEDGGGLTILGLSGIALVLVIIGVVVLCILPICVIVILALLGPAIGNVQSNIIEGI